MKKILVALVVLALAGGGAFAQGWTFNGLVDGGLGIFITEQDDDALMGLVGSRYGTVGVRTQLESRFTNADGNAGLFLRIRQDGTATNANIHAGFGWLSLMDNLITVYGGLVEHTHFNTLDRMTGMDMGEGLGLSFIVRPMENLTLGFGGFTRRDSELLLDDAPQAKFTFGAAFNEPDLFQVRFGFRNTNEVGGGWGNWGATPARSIPAGVFGATGAAAANNTTQGSLAYLSFAYLALDDIHVAATAGFQNLEEFDDFGAIRFYATFGHTGLVDNMDLRLGASFSMTMADDAGFHDQSPHIWVWASVAYELSDMIVPRFDLHYVMGGTAGDLGSLHHEQIRDNASFEAEHSFIQLRPSVQLRVSPTAFFELGCVINIDIGDWDTTNGGNGNNFGIYALVRVAF